MNPLFDKLGLFLMQFLCDLMESLSKNAVYNDWFPVFEVGVVIWGQGPAGP